MTIKELRDFIFENYYRRIGFTKENSYYSMKHQKILKKRFVKNKTSVKRSKTITQQAKTLENRNIIDIKSVAI